MKPPLEAAIELLVAMDRRNEERLARGATGEWQTEFNECRRCLHAIIEHLTPSPRFVYSRDKEPTDTWM